MKHLSETICLSTHNIGFGWVIIEILWGKIPVHSFLSSPLSIKIFFWPWGQHTHISTIACFRSFICNHDILLTLCSPPVPFSNTKNTFDDMLCSPESTAKTADSGIESLAQRLSEDTQLGSSLGSSPVPPSLGNDEVDQCLMYHLTYCERLLEEGLYWF